MHPSAGIVRVGALPLCVFAHLDVRPRALCGDRACRSAPAVRFCACGFAPAHPLRGSCVSERSRCAFLRMWICARAPSAGIARVGALPLCVFAHVDLRPRTVCGDRACRSAPAVRFCALYNLLRTPSAGIARVRFCVFSSVVVHPLRGSCVSDPSSPLPLLFLSSSSALLFLFLCSSFPLLFLFLSSSPLPLLSSSSPLPLLFLCSSSPLPLLFLSSSSSSPLPLLFLCSSFLLPLLESRLL